MTEKDIIHKLTYLLHGHRRKIFIIFGCLLISTGLNLCIPFISKEIMDEGFIGGNKNILLYLVVGSFAIYMLISALNIIKEKVRVEIVAKVQYSLWHQAYEHLMRMKINYFDDRNAAEIFNNLSVDIANMVSVADESAFFVVTQAFSMVGGVIGLFILDYRMTILVLLFIPIKAVVMKYFAKYRKKVMDEFILDSEKYSSWFGDTVGGVKEVKLFDILDNKHREFDEKQRVVIRKQKKMNMLSQWNSAADDVLVHLLITLIYIVGSNLVFNMQLSVGSIFAFITYSSYVTGPISAILNIGYLLSGIIPSTKRCLTRGYSFSNFGLPRPFSILSIVRLSKPKISASFSCESPSSVRDFRIASARFCFMSCIIIHLLSSLQYTSSGMNYSRIQILYGVEYMIKRRKREKDRYYILKTKSNMTYCTYCGVLQ